MKGLLFLLFCIEILGALFCGAQITQRPSHDLTVSKHPATPGQEDDTNSTFPASQAEAGHTSVSSSVTAIHLPSPASQDSNSHSSLRTPLPQPTTTSAATHFDMFYKKECLQVLMVAGGLIIACTILLMSTLLLTCKVCRMSRHIKLLSANTDMISTTEYWMGTAKKDRSTSATEAKETTVLMADITPTQEDASNGTAKEAGAKANEAGQRGEEDKKEVGDTFNSEDVSPVAIVQNASSSKPQEEATDGHSTQDEAASSCQGTGDPKDVV